MQGDAPGAYLAFGQRADLDAEAPAQIAEQEQTVAGVRQGQQRRRVIFSDHQVKDAHAAATLPPVEMARRAFGLALPADGDELDCRFRLARLGYRSSSRRLLL